MSVQEFSNLIKSQAYRDWFNRISTDVILKTGVSELREQEQTAQKTSFYITTNTISEVISAISGAGATPDQVNKVLSNLKQVTYGRSRKGIEKDPPFADGKAIYYPRVSFETINTVLEKGFKEILEEARRKNPKINISDFFDRGHVYGIFPKKVEDIKERLKNNTSMDEKGRNLLIGILDQLAKDLEKQDLDTSNLKDESYTLYSRYKKRRNKYLVELQIRNDNQEAGRAQGPLSKALRKFFNPGSLPVAKTGLKFTSGSGEQFLKSLIEGKGSPSLIDMITETIVESIKGNKVTDKQYSIPFVKINTAKIKVAKSGLQQQIKKEKASVKKLIASVKAVPKITARKAETLNLVNLQNLINQSLVERVKANMGRGERRDVLNLRTGRFAESVKVERMTESRQGMITAFYSYMKNPYATFSEGGRQSSPKSRDPKLLIAKSIREIATQQVANRLRSVNL
jgi:hypothetical protein